MATTARAAPADAVAMILIDAADGTSSLGSGFFVSADGRLLTCYHVIAGASTIRVVTADGWTDQVVVESIAPARDLAMLRVGRMRTRPEFLPLRPLMPPGELARVGVEVYTRPNAFVIERARPLAGPGRATAVRSEAFRHPTTRQPLFAVGDVDLLQLDLTVDRRSDGAPVVLDGDAIGVVSGSLLAEGSLGWAIPATYSRELTPLNLAAGQIGEWPPLSLMAAAWVSPARRVSLGSSLTTALDRVGRVIEASAALRDQATHELTELGNSAIARYRRAADLAVFRLGTRQHVEDLAPETEAEFLTALGPYEARAEYYDERFDALGMRGAIEALLEEVDRHMDRLPPSAARTALMDRVRGEMGRAFDGADAFEAHLSSSMAVFGTIADSYNTVETLGELRDDIERAATQFGDALQKKGPDSEVSVHLRAVMGVIESLFDAADLSFGLAESPSPAVR